METFRSEHYKTQNVFCLAGKYWMQEAATGSHHFCFFQVLYNNLMRVNFYRVLETVWRVVLQELTLTARNNVGERLPFFKRLFLALHHLCDFFHGNEKGLSLSSLHNPAYYDLDKFLQYHKDDTHTLIEQYCFTRLNEQHDQIQLCHHSPNPFGYLHVRTFYNAAAECLIVEG